MKKKYALFAFNGDPMCFIHVILNALDLMKLAVQRYAKSRGLLHIVNSRAKHQTSKLLIPT